MNTLYDKLSKDLQAGNISHANLVIGGSDKFETCKKWIEDLQEGTLNPLDNFFVEDDGSKFGIKELRELQNNMLLSPSSKYKVALIDNIERLSIPAINSILKILEEPPTNCIFVLTTSNLSLILDTVVSRCRLYESSSESVYEKNAYEMVLWDRDFSDAEIIEFVEENASNKAEALEFLVWIGYLFRDELKKSRKSELADCLILIQKTYHDVNRNVNARLSVELLLLRLRRLVSRINSKV